MGQNNRQRRANKARRRQRDQRFDGRPRVAPPSDVDDAGQLQQTIRELLDLLARPTWSTHSDCFPFFGRPLGVQLVAAANVLAHYIGQAAERGWLDTDLREVVRRRRSVATFDLLDVFLDDLRGDRTWQVIRDLHERPSGVDRLVAAAKLICDLPPLPVTSVGTEAAASSGIDERILRKVRALLAKAESTEYAAEAETLTAKAQQLMAKYAIELSVAESASNTTAGPTMRRIWVDAPYVSPKSSLIGAIARANHCRCIESSEWGFVSLVGHRADLDLVEVLTTSLLLQASRAMTLAGPQTDRFGASQTKSFRHSFLLAFAHRIGQRLQDATQSAHDEASVTTGAALVPILTARDDSVDAAVEHLFPDLMSRQSRISNSRGWGAGRAAADLARLDRRGTIAG